MKENNLSVTFIIPHRETESIETTVSNIKKLCEESRISYEILSVCGNNPTKQRNECIKLAKNEYIYFLDNDSILTKESFSELKNYLEVNPDTAVIGGPSVTPPSDSYLQKNFGAILSSFSAVGKISSRYSKQGKIRETDDSELILCNLVVKKAIFEKYGEFSAHLYPNEENEFIYRIKNSGEKVIYCPNVYVFRPHRDTLKNFIKQMFNYGRGRAEQTRVSPRSFKWFVLVPVIFSLYVLAGLFLITIFTVKRYILLFFTPFFAYLIIMLASFIYKSFKDKIIYIYYPLAYFLAHVCYGLGLLYGFLKRNFTADEKVFYHKIKRV
ncbi:MAG: glycosyltransferase family 2 protein [bacterium]